MSRVLGRNKVIVGGARSDVFKSKRVCKRGRGRSYSGSGRGTYGGKRSIVYLAVRGFIGVPTDHSARGSDIGSEQS